MPSRILDAATASLIPLVIFIHLWAAPFTKIEESFNIEATHDLMTYGFPKDYAEIASKYEHALYPGPVPRTFVGPVLLAAVGRFWQVHLEGLQRQILVRAALGLYNAGGILYYRSMVKQIYGQPAAHWFALFSATQFHVMFWASRTLPNFFVYGWCAFALADLLPSQSAAVPTGSASRGQAQRSLTGLTVLGIVFRSEIAVLLATHVLALLLLRRLSLREVVVAGTIGAVTGLLLTVPLDSFFWNKYPEWPELTSFLFNVVQGKSADWGVSPFHFYFTSALPRLFLNPILYLVCIPMALAQPALRPISAQLLAPNLVFVALYSILGHKERRFVIYTLPPLTAAAALGATWIWNRRTRTFLYRVLSAVLVISVALAFIGNMVMSAISSMNYPGGHAVLALHRVAQPTTPEVYVHMDTLSVMTGATRFMELGSDPNPSWRVKVTRKIRIDISPHRWIYDRTEQKDKTGNLTFWNGFDYALAELPERLSGDWEVIATVDGFAGVQLLGPGDEARDIGSGRVAALWRTVVKEVRRRFTRGRWAQVRMQPLIHVLKNQQRAG